MPPRFKRSLRAAWSLLDRLALRGPCCEGSPAGRAGPWLGPLHLPAPCASRRRRPGCRVTPVQGMPKAPGAPQPKTAAEFDVHGAVACR